MNELIFDKSVEFDVNDENYIDIITKDKNFICTCRGKMNSVYLSNVLKTFTFGIINISRIESRKEERKQILKELYESSSSSEDHIIYHDKIRINGFILVTENDDILEIDAVCSRVDSNKLGEKLIAQILSYCENNGIRICKLETDYEDLVFHYQKFGFNFIRKIDNTFYMEMII